MISIAVVTTSRADFGIYEPLLAAVAADPDCRLLLIAGGQHLSPALGRTVDMIRQGGWEVAAEVDCLSEDDTRLGNALGLARGVEGFARALADLEPDWTVVLGDRFEMLAAALAGATLGRALAHLHGGELTLGAMDDAFRHAMTKLSHLHFAASQDYARRIRQLGEEAWRVTVCGALSLDNLQRLELMGREELARDLDLDLATPPIVATFHPETMSDLSPAEQIAGLLGALDDLARPVIFTLPNADAGGRQLAGLVEEFSAARPWAAIRDNLGARRYFSLMALAAAMVGNSSSGILEAPSFGLPVVNLGDRQEGRTRAANIIDAGLSRAEVRAGLERALSPDFKASLAGMVSPFGSGGAAARILTKLKETPVNQRLLKKGFVDLGVPA